MPANMENSAVFTGLRKVSFHPVPKKGNAKECLNYHVTVLISHASKVISKSFKLGYSSMWVENVKEKCREMLKVGLKKAEEPDIKSPTSLDHRKSKVSPEKNVYFCFF